MVVRYFGIFEFCQLNTLDSHYWCSKNISEMKVSRIILLHHAWTMMNRPNTFLNWSSTKGTWWWLMEHLYPYLNKDSNLLPLKMIWPWKRRGFLKSYNSATTSAFSLKLREYLLKNLHVTGKFTDDSLAICNLKLLEYGRNYHSRKVSSQNWVENCLRNSSHPPYFEDFSSSEYHFLKNFDYVFQ